MKYAGDGHDHWHVRRILSYHLWSTRGTSRDAKIGFCFFDTNRRNTSLPGAPKLRKYHQKSGAARRRRPAHDERHLGRVGRPVSGQVRLPVDRHHRAARRDVHDPGGRRPVRPVHGVERGEQLHVGPGVVQGHGQQGQGRRRRVRSASTTTTTRPTPPTSTGPSAKVISGPATRDMFCTYDPVTRAQLASFLARAMDLPATDTDYFTDDDGTAREADINRAKAAGLFRGCTATTFCPNGKIARGSMATVLVACPGRCRRPTPTTSRTTRPTATRPTSTPSRRPG